MATVAEIWERGQVVIDSGVYAAKCSLKEGEGEADVMAMLSEGLQDSAMEGNGPIAVLNLLSQALVRLAKCEIDQEVADA